MAERAADNPRELHQYFNVELDAVLAGAQRDGKNPQSARKKIGTWRVHKDKGYLQDGVRRFLSGERPGFLIPGSVHLPSWPEGVWLSCFDVDKEEWTDRTLRALEAALKPVLVMRRQDKPKAHVWLATARVVGNGNIYLDGEHVGEVRGRSTDKGDGEPVGGGVRFYPGEGAALMEALKAGGGAVVPVDVLEPFLVPRSHSAELTFPEGGGPGAGTLDASRPSSVRKRDDDGQAGAPSGRLPTRGSAVVEGRIDWPAIAEPVVAHLLGPPNPRRSRGRRWRYGNKGSLSVDLDKATFYDFEAQVGGGLSKLIERRIDGDWKAARRWLETHGFIPPWRPDRRRSGRGRAADGKTAPGRAGAAARADPGESADEGARIALARALWQAADRGLVGTPALRYLARRGVWPAAEGFGPGWPALPKAIRWASRGALEDVDRAFPRFKVLHDFPPDAAGVLMAAYLAVPDCAGGRAVTMDALTEDGWRPAGERWRRTRGVGAGAACVMQANPAGHELAIVEGELDAIAVVLMARAGLGAFAHIAEVRAVNGTSGFQPDRIADRHGRPVVLMPDGPALDGSAKAAGRAVECAALLCARGQSARVQVRPPGDEDGDPARDLSVLVHERAARFETSDPEAADDGEDAERAAWHAILKLPQEEAA